MSKLKKYLYLTVGFIAFGLGALGVVLPVLPTTPFLLLASFCFARGSERFNNWFMGTSIYKKHLEAFVKRKEMTLKQKVIILGFAEAMISIPLILVDNNKMRIALIIIMLAKLYYFTFKIKTVKVSCELNR